MTFSLAPLKLKDFIKIFYFLDFTSVKYLTIQSPNILKIINIPEVPMVFLKDITLLTFTFFAVPLSDHFTLGFVISKN